MGPAQRAISLTTNFAKYSGVLRSGAGMVTPMLLNRSRTAGVSTASLVALARRRTISSGVPLGKESEPQLPQSRPARPSSCALGSCSRPGARSSPRGASGFDRAALNRGQRGRNRLGDEVDAPAYQILLRRRRAAIGHVRDLGAHGGVEQDGAYVHARAGPGRAVLHLSLVGLGVSDEF